MDYYPIPHTNLTVCRVALGTWAIGDQGSGRQ